MKRIKCVIGIMLCLLFVNEGNVAELMAEEIHNEKVSTPTKVRARSYKAKKICISWNKVDGATGYQVYQQKKGKSVEVADINALKTKWISPKTNKLQTYKVRAYKNENGKKVYSAFSYTVSAKPNNKKAKKVNAGIVYSKRYVYKLGLYETATPEIVIEKSKYAKNKKAKVIDKTLRWYSTNEAIATVDAKGVIHSKNVVGHCYVYARAHNGNYTKFIDVNVYNYARPERFTDLDCTQPFVEEFVNKYQDDMKAIAEYFEIYNKTRKVQYGSFILSDDRRTILTTGSLVDYEPVVDNLWNIFRDYPGDIEIGVRTGVVFDLSTGVYYISVSYTGRPYEISPYSASILLAPRWLYSYWRIDI